MNCERAACASDDDDASKSFFPPSGEGKKERERFENSGENSKNDYNDERRRRVKRGRTEGAEGEQRLWELRRRGLPRVVVAHLQGSGAGLRKPRSFVRGAEGRTRRCEFFFVFRNGHGKLHLQRGHRLPQALGFHLSLTKSLPLPGRRRHDGVGASATARAYKPQPRAPLAMDVIFWRVFAFLTLFKKAVEK